MGYNQSKAIALAKEFRRLVKEYEKSPSNILIKKLQGISVHHHKANGGRGDTLLQFNNMPILENIDVGKLDTFTNNFSVTLKEYENSPSDNLIKKLQNINTEHFKANAGQFAADGVVCLFEHFKVPQLKNMELQG